MTEVPEELDRRLITLRRDLHRIPEPAYGESETAARLIRELEALGISYEYHGTGGGIVASLPGADPAGPTVALRAEMDALPLDEATGLPFASQHPGHMHACGHDGHMAMITGAAQLFMADPGRGNLVLIYQPAEEGGSGAKLMVERGALDGVQMIFAGHMTRHYTTGTIVVPRGLVAAQSDRFVFALQGRGGHGARPHEGSDTIIPAASLILAMQSLITRESDAFHPAVVSVGCLSAGSAHNAIADNAVLEGIIRTTRPEDSGRIREAMTRIARSTGTAFNADISVSFDKHYPAVRNEGEAVAIAENSVRNLLGDEALLTREMPSMGAEDFSFYLNEVPGCYLRLGARPPGGEDIPLHSPHFDFDESLLAFGARYYARLVNDALAVLATAD